MFASLMVVRLREAIAESDPALLGKRAWQSPDDVPAEELPLARATEKVLASMNTVLEKTYQAREEELAEETLVDGGSSQDDRRTHLRRVRASEVRVVQCVDDLRHPNLGQSGFQAVALEADVDKDSHHE